MFKNKIIKKKQTILLLFVSLLFSEEYLFPLSSTSPPKITTFHWINSETNSALHINNIEIDIFQWTIIAKKQNNVKINILNPIWQIIDVNQNKIKLPQAIKISNIIDYQGTPIVKITLNPWKIKNGYIEALTSGILQIIVDPIDFEVTYRHPAAINYKSKDLQKLNQSETEYLIICPDIFLLPAQSLLSLHSHEVDFPHQLNTEIITTSSISQNIKAEDIREYILGRINNNLKFLLLLGNEIFIPPIMYNNSSNVFPSDDFYSTPEINSGNPQLISGRIPANSLEEAITIIDKIREYTLNPTPGIWRSKMAIVADDLLRSCKLDEIEISHSKYSKQIYDQFKSNLLVEPFYGIHFNIEQNNPSCTSPSMTNSLLQAINNGIGLINYIGHGNSETWGDEQIINKERDLNLINPINNKSAIWVAGTCSFGNYVGQNSFMEQLLLKKNGAIAIIATTDAIGYAPNWNYLKNFFGINNDHGLNNYINNRNDSRLGELVWIAKNITNDFKFHTFGDPALRIIFPSKASTPIIEDPPNSISLAEKNDILFSSLGNNSSFIIRSKENNFTFNYNDKIFSYQTSGKIFIQLDKAIQSNCYILPLDAGTCEDCISLIGYKENLNSWDNKIELLDNISLKENIENQTDYLGPNITIFQGNVQLSNGSSISSNTNLTFFFNDESGINTMNTVGHGVKYLLNDEKLTNMNSNDFIYIDCLSAFTNLPINYFSGSKLNIYVEAWDVLNNKSEIELDLNIMPSQDHNNTFINNVFVAPNPFSSSTNFTMLSNQTPLDIIINIYSINGEKIHTIEKSINECNTIHTQETNCFIKINWNGKDRYDNKIANGTYFYHLKVNGVNNFSYENIYKLSKIE